MLISACKLREEDDKEARAYGDMSRDRGWDARMFVTEDEERDNETSTANAEQTSKEADGASPKDKEQKLNRHQIHLTSISQAVERMKCRFTGSSSYPFSFIPSLLDKPQTAGGWYYRFFLS